MDWNKPLFAEENRAVTGALAVIGMTALAFIVLGVFVACVLTVIVEVSAH